MAITGATTTSSLEELIPAEQLSGIGDVARAVPIADMAAFSFGVSGSNTVRLPLLADAAVPLSESSGKTETDNFAATEQTSTEASFTAATVGIRKVPSDELGVFSPYPIEVILVRDSLLAMLEQLDEDVLSGITGAANTSDFSGSDLSIERIGTAVAALRLRNGPGMIMLVLHENQLEDLKKSYRAAGLAYGAAMGGQIAGNLNAQLRGSVGVHEGMPVLATTEVPQYDASNWAGAVVRKGSTPNNSGLAYAFWEQIRFERERDAVAGANNLITRAIYGSTLVRDDAIQELVSSKT